MTGESILEIPVGDDIVPFTVRGLDRTAWAALIHEHPTDDPHWRWDQATLYPALITRCVVDPAVDLAWAGRLAEDPDIGGDLIDLCLRLTEPGSLEWAKRRLSTDARLAAEVGASTRMGISHAEFTGWPVTSQDLALAALELAAQVCPGCGIPEKDMRRPEAWEPEARECWHCNELAQAREEIPEEHRHKVHHRLIPSGVS